MKLTASYKIAAAVVVIGALWWANTRYIVNPAVNAETARWQQRWDARDLADSKAALQQEKENREKEHALQAAADAEQQQADAEKDRLARELADQRASSERLQSGIRDAINQLSRASSGTTSGSTARPGSGGLLAELFSEINTAAGEYAAEADRARAAGLRCENIYNNARNAQHEKAR